MVERIMVDDELLVPQQQGDLVNSDLAGAGGGFITGCCVDVVVWGKF